MRGAVRALLLAAYVLLFESKEKSTQLSPSFSNETGWSASPTSPEMTRVQKRCAATFNRITTAVVVRAKKEGLPLEPFTVHDLRRTGSTLLNELGFNSDWI